MITSLRFEQMSFCYSQGQPIFENLNWEWPLDTSVWIQAQTGTGVSTLLRLMALLLEPTEGAFVINGMASSEMSFEESVPLRLKIGYGFDSGGLLHNRSLRDNLMLPALYHKIWSREEVGERIDRLLQLFALSAQQNQLPSAVSGGQRRLVNMLRALVLEPELLILDEPTVFLSAKVQLTLQQEILRLRREGSLRHIVFASEANEFAHRLVEKSVTFDVSKLSYVGSRE